MKAMKTFAIFFCTGTVLFIMAANVGAMLYQGSISPENGMIVNVSWSDASLGWNVDDNTNPGYWTYVYTWSSAENDLSHIDIEVSPTFSEGDLHKWFTNPTGFNLESTTPKAQNEIGGTIFDLKWEAETGVNSTNLELTLISNRAPIWGDFYAKDGGGNDILTSIFAYNSGFGNDPSNPIGNGNNSEHDVGGKAWVLVPDTRTSPPAVPEPATMILLGSGLVGLVGFSRKFRKC